MNALRILYFKEHSSNQMKLVNPENVKPPSINKVATQ